MKITFDQIKNKVTFEKKSLRDTFNVERLGVFGSVVRSENTSESDIDMIVELSQPISMITFIRLEDRLSHILGTKVDLVTERALKPAIKDSILKEVTYV